MLRMVVTTILFLILCFASTLHAEEEAPAVIAINPFIPLSSLRDTGWWLKSLRYKVAADLQQNYNCIILSRTNALTFLTERNLDSIKGIISSLGETPLPKVDYAITGYFEVGKRNPKTREVFLKCKLLIARPDSATGEPFKEIEFMPSESDMYLKGVTQAIATSLHLKKRTTPPYEKWNGKINETWAVLPIQHIYSRDSNSISKRKTTGMLLELALQESGKLKHIVDHNDLYKILEELKITELQNSTEATAGTIARLVGADKIIMGAVTRDNKINRDKRRIDLFLIDPKNAVIIDSSTVLCNLNEINSKIKDAVKVFLSRKYTIPSLEAASKEELEREVEIYDKVFWNIGMILNTQSRIEAMYSLAESICFLKADDHEYSDRILRWVQYHTRADYNKLPPRKQKEILKRLDGMFQSQKNYLPDDELIFSYCVFADLNYKLNEAISVAKSFLETSKEKDVLLSANGALASAYMYKKQYDLALKYGRTKGCEVELIDIIHAINDEKYDEEELEALDRCNFKSWAKRVYRRLHLINKLRTPEEAIENFNNLNDYAKVRTELLYEKCKALIKLNRQEEASLIILGLTQHNRGYYNFEIIDKQEQEKIMKEIKELKIKLQKYPPHLKDFKELIKISPKYVLYIQPLGTPDITAIKKAVPIIEEHFGCRVKILPRLPMPNDPYCFKREQMKYHGYHVVFRLKESISLPDDAIGIAAVTDKIIYCQNLRFVNDAPIGGFDLISYAQWYIADDDCIFTDMLAKAVSRELLINAGMRDSCANTICMNTIICDGMGNKYKTFKFCPQCAEQIKGKTTEDMLTLFKEMYAQKYPVYGSGDKKEWQEKYNKIVKAVLEKHKKDQTPAICNYQEVETVSLPLKEGLYYKYYELDQSACNSTDDCEKNAPTETGITDAFSFKKAKREEFFGLVFEGYIKIPYDGEYQFYLSSDDGSRLWIGGKEVINNDGLHAPHMKLGNIGLKAGYHKIKLSYMQAGLGKSLSLYYRGPKTLGQHVPSDILFHKAERQIE